MNLRQFWAAFNSEMLKAGLADKVQCMNEEGDIYDVMVVEYEPESNTLWLKTQLAEDEECE